MEILAFLGSLRHRTQGPDGEGRLLLRCELIVSVANLVHTDQLELFWNGAHVADNVTRRADWTYLVCSDKTPTHSHLEPRRFEYTIYYTKFTNPITITL